LNLLIDVGNSRLKWAQAGAGQWPARGELALEAGWPDRLVEQWSRIPTPRQVVVSNVAGPTLASQLDGCIRARWARSPVYVQAQKEAYGMVNGYRLPESLGSDRWVAMIAARQLCRQALCVVDAGTAVTVDAVDAGGRFVGGVIFPGLGLSRASLMAGTAAVKAGSDPSPDLLCHSTEEGVNAGTLYAVCGAIERLLREYRKLLAEPVAVYLTGGSAPHLIPLLSCQFVAEPDLVLRGLAYIADSIE
jgi:type III pantothenate kinase